MASTPALEARFSAALIESAHQAVASGYKPPPTRFLNMIAKSGGVQTVRDLLPNQSEGFTKLLILDKLELSAEAIMIRDEWRDLFTDAEREIARKRLQDAHYKFPPSAVMTPLKSEATPFNEKKLRTKLFPIVEATLRAAVNPIGTDEVFAAIERSGLLVDSDWEISTHGYESLPRWKHTGYEIIGTIVGKGVREPGREVVRIARGRYQIASAAESAPHADENTSDRLEVIRNLSDVADSFETFQRDAQKHPERTASLLRQTTFWIADGRGRFAPSKFVGYRAMTYDRYERAIGEDSTGVPFDGGVTKRAIETVAGREFAPTPSFGNALREYSAELLGSDLLTNADESKWAFITLALPAAAPSTVTTRTDWSEAECAAIVADYFDMLRAELLGESYSKAEHNRRLRERVNRSVPSIEFKHGNISAVLNELGQPYVNGYKPRGNYQTRLADQVAMFLEGHPNYLASDEIIAAIDNVAPFALPKLAASSFFEEPPEVILPTPSATRWLSRKWKRIDYVERDARNRALGRLGEEFALDLERNRLMEAGRDDLAKRVEWVSQSVGDGLGFDILSFDHTNEGEKWIEVKTTTLGKYHPFLVSANEVRCSEAEPDRYHLYRVFEFRRDPHVFVLPGSLSTRCELRPESYLAAARKLSDDPSDRPC